MPKTIPAAAAVPPAAAAVPPAAVPPAAVPPPATPPEYEGIKLLFDYTKYHIGIYTTLGTILVAVLGLHDNITLKFCGLLLWVSIGFIAVAGLAGGVIASTLPERTSLVRFFNDKTGFWGLEFLSGRIWTRIEHTAFWAGLIAGLISFVMPELAPRFTYKFCSIPRASSVLTFASEGSASVVDGMVVLWLDHPLGSALAEGDHT